VIATAHPATRLSRDPTLMSRDPTLISRDPTLVARHPTLVAPISTVGPGSTAARRRRSWHWPDRSPGHADTALQPHQHKLLPGIARLLVTVEPVTSYRGKPLSGHSRVPRGEV